MWVRIGQSTQRAGAAARRLQVPPATATLSLCSRPDGDHEVAPAFLQRHTASPEHAVTHVDRLRSGDRLDHFQGQVVDATVEQAPSVTQ